MTHNAQTVLLLHSSFSFFSQHINWYHIYTYVSNKTKMEPNMIGTMQAICEIHSKWNWAFNDHLKSKITIAPFFFFFFFFFFQPTSNNITFPYIYIYIYIYHVRQNGAKFMYNRICLEKKENARFWSINSSSKVNKNGFLLFFSFSFLFLFII